MDFEDNFGRVKSQRGIVLRQTEVCAGTVSEETWCLVAVSAVFEASWPQGEFDIRAGSGVDHLPWQ